MMQKVKSGAAPEAVPIAAKAVVEETLPRTINMPNKG
jgi:hypothetical protein|tara:strand:- start:1384 stop:1494 length:111 start_codon:yes stop_codon:yes gene_type:complete